MLPPCGVVALAVVVLTTLGVVALAVVVLTTLGVVSVTVVVLPPCGVVAVTVVVLPPCGVVAVVVFGETMIAPSMSTTGTLLPFSSEIYVLAESQETGYIPLSQSSGTV